MDISDSNLNSNLIILLNEYNNGKKINNFYDLLCEIIKAYNLIDANNQLSSLNIPLLTELTNSCSTKIIPQNNDLKTYLKDIENHVYNNLDKLSNVNLKKGSNGKLELTTPSTPAPGPSRVQTCGNYHKKYIKIIFNSIFNYI